MFNILTTFSCNYDNESVWNCRFCTNLTYGCSKCQIKSNDDCYIMCRSFQYFIFHKIRCECLGQGCNYCKNKGFIVEKIHNYKQHDHSVYENDIEYIKFTEDYTIIEEEDWNHFKCLNTFFIPPSEKEKLKKNLQSHDNFKRILVDTVSKIIPKLMEKFVK